jgi:hypothetical protein
VGKVVECFCQPKTGPFDNRKQAHLAHFA